MTRFRITARGVDVELRGYVDGVANAAILADAVKPMGLVVMASEAADNFNPFAISEPEFPPSPELSREVIRLQMEDFGVENDGLLERLTQLHYAQALVIRGERGQREFFEQENEILSVVAEQGVSAENLLRRIKTARSNHPDLPVCEKHPDPQDYVKCGWRSAIEDIDKVLVEVPE